MTNKPLIVPENTITLIFSDVDRANGNRRERLLFDDDIFHACERAAENPGTLVVIGGGNVPNSYRYTASQTVFAVTMFRGLLYYRVGVISASKGSSLYTWFGGHGKHSERENAKALRTNSATKKVKGR